MTKQTENRVARLIERAVQAGMHVDDSVDDGHRFIWISEHAPDHVLHSYGRRFLICSQCEPGGHTVATDASRRFGQVGANKSVTLKAIGLAIADIRSYREWIARNDAQQVAA